MMSLEEITAYCEDSKIFGMHTKKDLIAFLQLIHDLGYRWGNGMPFNSKIEIQKVIDTSKNVKYKYYIHPKSGTFFSQGDGHTDIIHFEVMHINRTLYRFKKDEL